MKDKNCYIEVNIPWHLILKMLRIMIRTCTINNAITLFEPNSSLGKNFEIVFFPSHFYSQEGTVVVVTSDPLFK